MTVGFARQHNNAIEAAKVIVDKLHGAVYRLTPQWVEVGELNFIKALRLNEGAGVAHRLQRTKRQQHMSPTLELSLGIGQRFFMIRATENQHHVIGEILKALVRPRDQL